MATIKIELNHDGIASILKGQGALDRCDGIAAKIAAAASAGGANGTFGHNAQVGRNRARAIAFTADTKAEVAEATDRVLTRAIDAGRS